MANTISKTATPKLAIVDYDVDNNNVASSKITFETDAPIQQIAVNVDIAHTYIGDIEVTLKSPDGTEIYLHNKTDSSTQNIKKTYNTENCYDLNKFIGKASKGEWELSVKDRRGRDSGTFNEWQLDLGVSNMLQINNGAYVSIPANTAYNFGKKAFSVMAYVSPKKIESGNTVLTQGTIFSSKPAPGGRNNGGWQLFLEKEGEDLMLCFKTDDGNGYHLLKAPINNLYDDKAIRNPYGAVVDLARSNSLFKEYTHFVAAVRGESGDMNLYVNGYLIARATPFEPAGTTMTTESFQLKGMFKESIDKTTHFFTVKKDKTTYTAGWADWNVDNFTSIGESFNMSSVPSSKETILSTEERNSKDISSIITKIENLIPAKNMIAANRVSLLIKPANGQQKVKLLAQFAANVGPSENVDNAIGLSIGRTEQYSDPYEGYVKHVSLWKTALSQADIISYMDSKKLEKDSQDCVGFWKLENDFKDSSSIKNDGSKNGSLEHVYQYQILPVYVEEQQNQVWCWAASDLAIVEYYNPMSQDSQQQIVNKAKDSNGQYMNNNTRLVLADYTRCDPAPNWWKTLETALVNSNNSFISKFLCAPEFKKEIDFDILRGEINKGNPLLVGVVWVDKIAKKTLKTGHAMVLTGIIQQDGQYLLVVNDPWSGIIYIKIEDFAGGNYNGNGFWGNTTITISNNQLD